MLGFLEIIRRMTAWKTNHGGQGRGGLETGVNELIEEEDGGSGLGAGRWISGWGGLGWLGEVGGDVCVLFSHGLVYYR